MAYHFNNGRGAATCDRCRIIMDEDLTFKEYEELYADEDGEYICWRCEKKEEETT